MNDQLKRLLEHLAATLNPWRQAEIEKLHRKALAWEPVRRLPLTVWTATHTELVQSVGAAPIPEA
jgi:hypothetical protein